MDDGLSGAVGASATLAVAATALGGPVGTPHGPALACLNCASPLAPAAHFCSQCGQDTANHPPSLFEFAHEFVSHYIAAEGRLWKSLWGLLARPGFLTREYLAGRKQRYVLPLRLILTFGLLFFLALKLTSGGAVKAATDSAPQAASSASVPAGVDVEIASRSTHIGPRVARHEADREASAASSADSDEDGDTPPIQMSAEDWQQIPPALRARLKQANDNWRADPDAVTKSMGATMLALAPYAVLCSLPFFAALLKLLFWRQTYGAHFVFAMHLHAAWYAMLLIATLLPWVGVGFAVWLWSNVYPVLALKRVHAASWWTTLLRAAVLALAHLTLLALGLAVLAVIGAVAAG